MMEKKLEVSSTQKVYEGFFDFEEALICDLENKRHPYVTLRAKADGVVILAENDQKTFLVVEEYRYPVDKKILSLPGGRIEKGESHLDCAHRELKEETGFRAKKMSFLGEFYPFPSVSDQKILIFLAKELEKISNPNYDPLERIDLQKKSYQELKHLDSKKNHLDSTVAMALFFYDQHQLIIDL